MDEDEFTQLFQRLVEEENLDKEIAQELLRQILKILFPKEKTKIFTEREKNQ